MASPRAAPRARRREPSRARRRRCSAARTKTRTTRSRLAGEAVRVRARPASAGRVAARARAEGSAIARPGGDIASYVYGVVRSGDGGPPKGNGIDGKRLRVVSSKGIGALASDVRAGPLGAGRDELMAHSRVLERAVERGVVLPMRFGV